MFLKQIFSNANKEHVAKVLGRLGLEDCFDGVISFETLNSITKTEINAESPKNPVVCKPFEDAFEQAFAIAQIDPQRTVR